MQLKNQARVAVIGGGFAGLEAAFYLRWRLGDRVDLTLVSDRDRFTFKPNTIYIPFGADPRRFEIPLARPTRSRGIAFVQAAIHEVDFTNKSFRIDERKIPYDYLVLATGAGMRPTEVPGLTEYGLSIWTPADMLSLRAAYANLLEAVQNGLKRRVVFMVPPNNKCAGPLYEMVFMFDAWLRRRGVRKMVDITWSTYERSFIQAFGPRLHEVVSPAFHRLGITGRLADKVEAVEPGAVVYQGGERLLFDLLVAFPPYVAANNFAGLTTDERGFVATDPATRQVRGVSDVYAAGDTGDFPVKQAFLAFLQADTVAEHIATRILNKPFDHAFDPTSMCVMERFDTATFAQVPLRTTGLSDRPVEVRPDADGAYRVGTSPLWRIGKQYLGLYLPWRFGSGQPFHAGAAWKATDLMLKAMSRVMAA